MKMSEPLALKLAPTSLNEVIGQKHLIGENKILRKCVENKHLFSMILHGPAGCGKTTLARVLANECELPYRLFNAVTGNKKELDQLFEESKYFSCYWITEHISTSYKNNLMLSHFQHSEGIHKGISMIRSKNYSPISWNIFGAFNAYFRKCKVIHK